MNTMAGQFTVEVASPRCRFVESRWFLSDHRRRSYGIIQLADGRRVVMVRHCAGRGRRWVLVARRYCLVQRAVRHLHKYPHKRRQSRWKLSQELKGKQATFFAKYKCVEMTSRKIQTYKNEAKNLCTIYFVFDLDGECKFIKTKQYSD